MAAAQPISEVLIDVDRAAVDALANTKAAIDRGCSLSKFLYLPKDRNRDVSHYTFHCALFRNCDFEGALYFLKEKAELPSEGKLRVTGAGCHTYKELIAQVLGLEIEFISEFVTIFRGPHFLVTHAVSRETLYYKGVEFERPSFQRSEMMEKAVAETHQRLSQNNSKSKEEVFPVIFVLIGSAAVGMLIEPDGRTKLLGGSALAGRALMGFGQALVGTSNYDEIMELAAAGDASKVDTTVEEFLKSDASSNYGRFPKHLPLFSFGKLADSDKCLEDFSREDRAASLVRMFSSMIVSRIWGFLNQCFVSRIIIGGNGIGAEVMRKMITRSLAFASGGMAEVKFLRTGHTGAFGAMIATPSDVALV